MKNKNTISLRTENGIINIIQNETMGRIYINEFENGKPYKNICSISNLDMLEIIIRYIEQKKGK